MEKFKPELQSLSKNKEAELPIYELKDNCKRNNLMLGSDIAEIKEILDDSSNENKSPLLTPKISVK